MLEIFQIRLPSITSDGFQAVFLTTFSVSLISDACATVMAIFQILQAGPTDSQLTSWDTYRGAIMNVIDRVVLPVILLNVTNACFQYHSGQNAVGPHRTNICDASPLTPIPQLDCITHGISLALAGLFCPLLTLC